MAGVRLEHIVKRYPDGTEAVKDFHLEIKDKEFIVFVGPSGCGKSTTLRMIAGLEDISDGNLYIGDRRVNDVPPKDRDIAMVFQSYALYPHMSVFQNMAFGLKLRKFKKMDIEKRVKAAAKILDLEELLERRPKALSGGQQQRVALGRAIVREPQVFLMDEPLSNLDAKLRSQMRTEISKLHRRLETTMIYVTHDQIEAMTMGDRIVVMSSGVIQQAASPEDLYRYPSNVFVAGFIGSPAMNFVRGNVTEVDGHIMFISEGLNVAVPDGRAQILKEKDYIGKEVIFGIRPEDIHDEPVFLEGSQESIFTAHIEVAENLGAEMYIHISGVGRDLITARLDGRTAYKEASEVKLALDMNKIHMFDIETEQSIFGRL